MGALPTLCCMVICIPIIFLIAVVLLVALIAVIAVVAARADNRSAGQAPHFPPWQHYGHPGPWAGPYGCPVCGGPLYFDQYRGAWVCWTCIQDMQERRFP